MNVKKQRRAGFTLVELLVVITIIGILMGLVLPAVQSAVKSARTLECLNNMASVAKAAAVYESGGKKGYPRYVNSVGPKSDRVVSWQVVLLPFLERSDVLDQYKDATIVPQRPVLKMFICPSDPPEFSDEPSNSFVINAGMATENVELERRADGISFFKINTPSAVVKDGISNTMLLSENIQATTWDGAPTLPTPSGWNGVPTKLATTFMWRMTRQPSSESLINGPSGGNLDNVDLSLNTARPSSNHTGGVNVAFCDGHGAFLREDLDYKVYIQLMTSNHRESSLQETSSGMPPEYKTYILSDADFE